MRLLQYLYYCWKAYRSAAGVSYFAVCGVGQVPRLVVMIGRDRSAWQVTQLALEHKLTSAAFERRD